MNDASPPPALPDTADQQAAALAVVTDQEVHAARAYVEASRAQSTRRAYAGDWQRFAIWCLARATPALPATPAVVAVYLSALAASGLAPPSIARALAAIAHHHKQAGPDRKTAVDADLAPPL